MPRWHNLVLRKTGNLVSARISRFKKSKLKLCFESPGRGVFYLFFHCPHGVVRPSIWASRGGNQRFPSVSWFPPETAYDMGSNLLEGQCLRH